VPHINACKDINMAPRYRIMTIHAAIPRDP
jgi:hypothetical protein